MMWEAPMGVMVCNLLREGVVGVIWFWFTGVLGLYAFFFLSFMFHGLHDIFV